MQNPGTWALPLSDSRCTEAAIAGGKAAELGRLLEEGYPVPEAFLLPVSTFYHHFESVSPDRTPERPWLNSELSATLAGICNELSPTGEDRLVVRSSALGEDGATASFAGQHATYYYVTRRDIDKAVVDCWMSLWSPEALAYRQNHPTPEGGFGMAVIVQRMIQSERSGVCFTEDPTGAEPGTAIVESTWGLGAALVDGRVSPDRFRVGADGVISERKITRKRLKVGEDLRDPSEHRLEPVPLNQQSRATLTDIEVAQIVSIARSIAQRRGVPQDVEWAIDGDELFVLQARPVTGTETAVSPAVSGRWVLFKPTVENFSEPFTPMTVDLFRRILPPLGCFIQGRYYVNADLLAKLLPWDLDDATLADLLLMRGVPALRTPGWRRLMTIGGLLSLGYLVGGITWHRTANLPPERLQAFERRCEEVMSDDDLDPLAALKKLVFNDHPFRPMGEFAIQANISSVRYFLLTDLLKRLLDRIAPAFDQTRLGMICSGGSRMLSQQMVEGIRRLADIAREDNQLRTAMLAEGGDLQAIIARLADDHPFAGALQNFMRRFGHRAVRELDLMAPRWREDNTTVLVMVRNYLKTDPLLTGADGRTISRRIDSHGLLLAAEDELHQSLESAWQRRLVDHLVDRIRFYVTLRENTRYYHTMAIATVRLKLQRLEQELLQSGRLRCEDDIFFLEYPEVMALQVGAMGWAEAEPIIRERRVRYRRLSQLPPTESFNLATRPPVVASDRNVLTGDCASPGVATGTARVIRDPSIATELEPGDILIAPYTDPAWTPLFPGAGAIIVEVGSYLSHAGTVAREYQVPCLVDVHDCMRRIRSGQQLRVNATEGWVEILS